jgi:hypothetical protein
VAKEPTADYVIGRPVELEKEWFADLESPELLLPARLPEVDPSRFACQWRFLGRLAFSAVGKSVKETSAASLLLPERLMQIARDYAGVAICGVVHITRARGEGSQIPLHTSDLGEQLAAVRRIGGSVDQVYPVAGMAQNAVAVDSASAALQSVAFTAEWAFTKTTCCGKSEDGGGGG